MQEWIEQTLETPALSVPVLGAAFVLGVLVSVTSCCSFTALGAIAGYSGAISDNDNPRRGLVTTGSFFLLGSVLALGILGAVTGFVSQAAGLVLGAYWKFFAGLLLVVFGLATMDLVPFSLPKLGINPRNAGSGFAGAMVYGLAVGGATTVCKTGCNPLIYAVLGLAALQGRTLMGTIILAVFAVGYSMPLAAGLVGLGVGLGKISSLIKKSERFVQLASGLLLIGVGFYLLATA